MGQDTEQLYQQRLKRYVTAMRNEKPDMIPIRPFVAEFVAKYAGYTHEQVTQDLELALEAVRICAKDFDWDAVVPNMIHNWTGVIQAIGLKCYAMPGVDMEPEKGTPQYREPSEENAFMKADEYDRFIADPTAYLFEVWLPRITNHIVSPGEVATYRSNLSLLKGGMAMMAWFGALGNAVDKLRSECGTVGAISGMLKAPLDLLGDRFRGYIGVSLDLMEKPDMVLKACEAMMPHITHMALGGADPAKNVPITIWMHRGCVPFVSMDQFKNIYWPTLKPIVQEIWSKGHQVLFYAEGKWGAHLDSFAELDDGSIILHVDQDDVFEVHKKLGHKFAISGGVPNYLMSFGEPDEVRAFCKKVIKEVAGDGGYIMDAAAIMQDDTKEENLRAMTEVTRELGVY